jgi:hypothetical protein
MGHFLLYSVRIGVTTVTNSAAPQAAREVAPVQENSRTDTCATTQDFSIDILVKPKIRENIAKNPLFKITHPLLPALEQQITNNMAKQI